MKKLLLCCSVLVFFAFDGYSQDKQTAKKDYWGYVIESR